MKKKIEYPGGWTAPYYLLISQGDDKRKPVWTEFKRNDEDLLTLRVTVEIVAGSTLFENFENEEVRARVAKERGRAEAWRNAVDFAEKLWKSHPDRQYIVMFRPESPNTGREVILVCQRIRMPTTPREESHEA